jgi:hypothetical protein
MLGFNYHSKFYGQDLIETPANRAFISTYQLLGYFKDDILVILSPKANPIAYRIENNEQTLIEAEEELN